MKKNISAHISYKEATRSQTAVRRGINNDPDEGTIWAMENVAEMCFEPIRKWYGKPIGINSFYRSPELNKAVGGSKTSEHPKGYCIDMDTENDNREIFEWCIDNLEFDQLVAEFKDDDGVNPRWIHISYRIDSTKNRGSILIAHKVNGKTKYSKHSDELFKEIYG